MREAFSKMAATLQPAASKAGKMNTSPANAIDKNKQVNIYQSAPFHEKLVVDASDIVRQKLSPG